ncbi:hypothetical protein [Dyella jiangningensis]
MDPRLAAIEIRDELLRLHWPNSISVAQRNGVEAGNGAQWARDKRRAGELLGVWSAPAREFVHPDFQFDQYGQLRHAEVRALLAALAFCEDFTQEADRGGWRRAFWLYGKSSELLDGAGEMQAPAERFATDPAVVIELAREVAGSRNGDEWW